VQKGSDGTERLLRSFEALGDREIARAPFGRGPHKVRHQPRLADARFAADEHQGALALGKRPARVIENGQLFLPSYEHGRRYGATNHRNLATAKRRNVVGQAPDSGLRGRTPNVRCGRR